MLLACAWFDTLSDTHADPGKQFDMVAQHITKIRSLPGRKATRFTIFVERNLGFEAEHHQRALGQLPGVKFYVEAKANRVGMMMTEPIKHAMAQLVVVMLHEHRLHVMPEESLVSSDPKGTRIRLREELEIYCQQVKAAESVFQKDRIALSGKIGGLQDDLAICLQWMAYMTQLEDQRARDSFTGPG